MGDKALLNLYSFFVITSNKHGFVNLTFPFVIVVVPNRHICFFQTIFYL